MNDHQTMTQTGDEIFEYDMESLRTRYTEYSEHELNAAIGLMMLAHSAPAQTQTTPDNYEQEQPKPFRVQLEPKKTMRYSTVRKIGQRRESICYARPPTNTVRPGSLNVASRPVVNRSPSTTKLLSTCRNILTEFMRSNIG